MILKIQLNIVFLIYMKGLLFAICQLIATAAFSQETTPSPPSAQDDYLKKSERQHTAGLALLIGGGAALAGGIIWGTAESNTNGASYAKYDGAGTLVLVGIASMLGSIPLFIASHHNAKKARTIAAHFKFEKGPDLRGIGMACHAIPGFALSLGF
jgi:drug/metabolite transporter (DMT)-like permease